MPYDLIINDYSLLLIWERNHVVKFLTIAIDRQTTWLLELSSSAKNQANRPKSSTKLRNKTAPQAAGADPSQCNATNRKRLTD